MLAVTVRHIQRESMQALAAGYYPSILRVEHPAVRYHAVEGGTQEVDAQPSELRFMDKHKGISFSCCRFTSILYHMSNAVAVCHYVMLLTRRPRLPNVTE